MQDFRKQKRLSAAHCYAKAVVGLDSCSASCQHLQVFLEAGHQTFLQNDSGKFCKVVREWIEHLISLMQQDTESAVKHPLFRAPKEDAQGRADGSGRWIGHQAEGIHHQRPKLCLEAFGGTLATAIKSQKCCSSPTWTHATRNYSETPE